MTTERVSARSAAAQSPVATTTTTTTRTISPSGVDRTVAWTAYTDFDQSEKENIGYVVRRPSRMETVSSATEDSIEAPPVRPRKNGKRRLSEILRTSTERDEDEDNDGNEEKAERAPSTTPGYGKGKKKLKRSRSLPLTEKEAMSLRAMQAKTKTMTQGETKPAPSPPVAPRRVRRPLEDITHLFVPPNAYQLQPWSRASRWNPPSSNPLRFR